MVTSSVFLVLSICLISFIISHCDEYPCYHVRTTLPLDGLWKFAYKPRGVDPAAIVPSGLTFNDTMYIPGVWDALPPYAGLRGAGIYKRTSQQTPNTYGKIKFEACSMWCKIFIDGTEVGTHANGYTAFYVNVPQSANRLREIVVIADNQFVSARYPIGYYDMDFYQYGGIPRTVQLYEVPITHIKNMDIMVTDHDAGIMSIRVRVDSLTTYPNTIDFNVIFDGSESTKVTAKFVDGIYFISDVKISNPTKWSPSNPILHTVQVQLLNDKSIPIDELEERFGIRTVTACGNSICVNGEPIKLKGYNRHDIQANYGPHMPKVQMYQDIMLLKNVNGNFFRLVHYPHDPRFLSLCDEMGVLIWQEGYGWGNGEGQMTNPAFQAAEILGLEEMVNNTVNHPCVILWAYLNEGCSDSQKCCDQMYTPLAQRYKQLGVPGLVTYASNKRGSDVCLHTVDVVSFNSYPGWFQGSDDIQANLDSIVPYVLNEATISKSKFPNKPFLKSEIGGESVWGWEDAFNGLWTQNFQTRYVEQVLKAVVGNDTFAGIAIWQFFDTRTYNGHSALSRPRAINNMGSLDEYRRPKPVYYLVKDKYQNWK